MQRALALILFGALLGAVGFLDRRSRGDFDRLETAFGFALVDETQAAGLDFVHRAASLDPQIDHIADHIMAVGAAVAVVDHDGDGHLDLFFTNSDFGAACALYRGRGDGTFEDVTRGSGLEDLNRTGEGVCMGTVWGDVDRDGDQDVFIYRYGETALMLGQGDGTYAPAGEQSGLQHWMNSNAACWFDYDRDGWLDLVVTGYYRAEHDLWDMRTTEVMHDSGQFAENGGRNRLFRNLGLDATGAPHFEEVTNQVGLSSTRWTLAVTAADLNGDGWQDLYLANDYNEEECLINRPDTEGGRIFEALDVGFDHNSKSGMSISLGSLKNDGRLALFITNISADGWLHHGNNLRLNYVAESEELLEQASGAILNTGWSWGAHFGDLDNDGFQDLVVANGFVSGDDRQYWYEASKLSSGRGTILADAAQWPPFDGRSQSGYERSRILLNNKGRRFVEVGEQVGVTDTYDGRAIVLFDADEDGRLDLVVANQKAPALLYRNRPAGASESGSWIALSLRGTSSNPDAFGATVTALFGDQRQVQVLTSQSGFSAQSGPRLHFGLGDHTGPVGFEVTWPSGIQQVVPGLEAGRYHKLTEPEQDQTR